MKVDWSKRACRDTDPELFFDDDRVADAIAICSGCPIKQGCDQYAYSKNEKYGVWGGVERETRAKLVRPLNRVKCLGCGSIDQLNDENHAVCLSCGLTWRVL